LLARYHVGLADFYNYFVGDHTIVILLLEELPEKSEWPDEVRCDSKRLPGYFSEAGMVKETYSAKV